jgi:hypothetical protein
MTEVNVHVMPAIRVLHKKMFSLQDAAGCCMKGFCCRKQHVLAQSKVSQSLQPTYITKHLLCSNDGCAGSTRYVVLLLLLLCC